MNILFLSPFFPYPLDQGGKIRIFNILKNLSTSHSITLVAMVDNYQITCTLPFNELCEEVMLVERPARLWPDRFGFFSGRAPYNVIRYRCAKMRETLKSLTQRRKFDLVQIEFSMMWQYARLFTGIPVLLDAHNIEYRNVQQIGNAATTLLWKTMYQLEKRRLQAVEEAAWRECACCFTVSDAERDAIAAVIGDDEKVVTAANGVDPERFQFRPRDRKGKKILFLGGMDYAPNLDAATFFLAEVFPLIRREEPEACVLLVGRELDKLRELAHLPGVKCHESVPEVLPWFYEADVLAVPLRLGAGTRIKVLEAMAAGLPVVSTSKGCEGIAAESGKHLVVADTAMEFARAVSKTLNDPDQGVTLAKNARDLVIERYTWQSAADTMERCYGDVLRRFALSGVKSPKEVMT